VVRHGQGPAKVGMRQHHVRTAAPGQRPSGALQFLDGLATADQAQALGHYTDTTTGSPWAGLALEAITSNHPAMASFILAIASRRLRPCETQPGMAGTSAT